jgi:hypothetical protein
MCDRTLEKDRHYVENEGVLWTIDVYDGVLKGVVIAEVELDRADRESLFEWFDPLSETIASHDGMNAVTCRRSGDPTGAPPKPLRLQRQIFSARARLRCRAPHSAEPHSANTFV